MTAEALTVPGQHLSVQLEDIRAAAELLEGVIVRTPWTTPVRWDG